MQGRVELDGVWEVRRVGGLLPPLFAVRKEIAGSRGATRVGPLPGVPFLVDGLALRYRPPFAGFVDYLEPDNRGYKGIATVLGREYGRFALRRIGGRPRHLTEEEGMAAEHLTEQLVKHIDEAYAMEQSVLRMLDSMIATMEDPELKTKLEQHKTETTRHAADLEQRLQAHDASPSVVREAGGILGALMKTVVDLARGEKAGRNARDGYATEHLEIASYQLLERIARRAGDEETAKVARRNRADEERMAATIDASWDTFADLVLKEEGVTV